MTAGSFTLFAANVVVVMVMAAAFELAGRGRRNEPYWQAWRDGNLVIALALICFMYERHLPDVFIVIIPNSLLVLGLGLRWRAARQFGGRPESLAAAAAPALLFLGLCLIPAVFGSYGTVYTAVNILLAALAGAAAYEFWRDRRDGLPSRQALVLVYAVMAVSFAARVGQGMVAGSEMARHLPDDLMLIIHLTAALCYTVGSGAFALSLAYERGARELQRAAMRDSLSGLFNRGAFEQHVRERLAAGECGEFAIVFFDIDSFKLFNDRFGHAAGDEAIRQCAKACTEGMRGTDFVARIGGEEFAAILTEVTVEEAFGIVDRIRQKVAAMPINVGGTQQYLTISAGICHSVSGFRDFDELLQMADRGLYRAKHLGRNRVEQLAA